MLRVERVYPRKGKAPILWRRMGCGFLHLWKTVGATGQQSSDYLECEDQEEEQA